MLNPQFKATHYIFPHFQERRIILRQKITLSRESSFPRFFSSHNVKREISNSNSLALCPWLASLEPTQPPPTWEMIAQVLNSSYMFVDQLWGFFHSLQYYFETIFPDTQDLFSLFHLLISSASLSGIFDRTPPPLPISAINFLNVASSSLPAPLSFYSRALSSYDRVARWALWRAELPDDPQTRGRPMLAAFFRSSQLWSMDSISSEFVTLEKVVFSPHQQSEGRKIPSDFFSWKNGTEGNTSVNDVNDAALAECRGIFSSIKRRVFPSLIALLQLAGRNQ